MLLHLALKHRATIRLIDALDERSYVLVPEAELFIRLFAKRRCLSAIYARLSRCFIES